MCWRGELQSQGELFGTPWDEGELFDSKLIACNEAGRGFNDSKSRSKRGGVKGLINHDVCVSWEKIEVNHVLVSIRGAMRPMETLRRIVV